MKELRLKALTFGTIEKLTRAEMKKVMGGNVPPPNNCTNSCQFNDSSNACAEGYKCKTEACPDDANFTHNICV